MDRAICKQQKEPFKITDYCKNVYTGVTSTIARSRNVPLDLSDLPDLTEMLIVKSK